MARTVIDPGSVIYADPIHENDTLNFTAGATYKAGTILGRITASGKLFPFTVGAADGTQNPIAVLTYEVTRASAGDTPCRAMIGGIVRHDRLVVHAAGNNSTLTQAHVDALRAAGVTAVKVKDLSVLDN